MSDKSIYGSYGFSTMLGKILEATPGGMFSDEATLNNASEELFSLLSAEFFIDKEVGLGITQDDLKRIMTDPKKSIFAQLQAIRTESHKQYKELKDNKLLNMLIVDFNEALPRGLEWFIRTPFRTLNDRWETDDYIEGFEDLAQHKSAAVRELSKILYVYSYYTSGWRQRRHSFHTYIPTSMSKEIQVGKDKYASFNRFIKDLRRQLNDKDYAITHVTSAKRHIFRNNWFDKRFVAQMPESHVTDIKQGDTVVGMEIETKVNKGHYKGRNKEGQHIFSPYLLVDEEAGPTSLLEYIGFNTKTGFPIYRVVPRKGFYEGGITFREYGFKKEESAINIQNPPGFISEKAFIEMMESNEDIITIPFEQQEVVDKTRYEDAFFRDFTRLEGEQETTVYEPVESIPTTKVISGAQTGVDRMGLEVAKAADIETGGTATPGFLTEQGYDVGVTKFGVVAATPEEQATFGNENYWTARTELNVINSDATLYIDVLGRKDKGGLGATRGYAAKHNKPFLLVNETANPNAIRQWLVDEKIETLNIAGNRGSTLTTTQTRRIKQMLTEILTGESLEAVTSRALSTPELPIKIFTDGSSVQKTGTMGYGAYFKWQGEEYSMSGVNKDVNRILEVYQEQLKESKNPSPTMELLGMLEALRKFSDTSEHLYILTDNMNNVNYEGIWDRAVVNEYQAESAGLSGKRTKPTKPNATGKAPWIEFIVPEIMKQVEKIEENGGSVRFQWIPGHIDNSKVTDNSHAFAIEDGGVSTDLAREYKIGNSKADEMAQSTTKSSSFRTLGAPTIESVEALIDKSDERYQERSEDGLPIC
jgi:ribonuclease HI